MSLPVPLRSASQDVRRIMASEKREHVLIVGGPATGKSTLLEEATKTAGCLYCANVAIAPGWIEYSMKLPTTKFFVMEEIDRLSRESMATLIAEVANPKSARLIATASDTGRIPQGLLDLVHVVRLEERTTMNPYGFGNENYRWYKDGYAWVCGSCGYLRATSSSKSPEHPCAICNATDWNRLRSFL